MKKCGLLGEKLGHSYSPRIHSLMADYEYKLYEIPQDDLEAFVKEGDWDGLNVTIPYKKAVVPLCDELSEAALSIGSVNTLVKKKVSVKDGNNEAYKTVIYGDNTDLYGFKCLMEKNNVDPKGKKTLVLGNGGACASVRAVLEGAGADTVVISRRGENNYDNLHLHKDAKIIVNTTPVGMYPRNGESPLDLACFTGLEAVLDIVYNPSGTALVLQAERMGIPAASGLYMLVAQAAGSSSLFSGNTVSKEKIDEIYRNLLYGMQNIILVGMPGSGKTTVAAKLSELTGRKSVDLDEAFTEKYGFTPEACITGQGELQFRKLETEVIREYGAKSGLIISTGGGAVTVEENYDLLHQNGIIVWIQRDISSLPVDGRPISQKNPVRELYEKRKSMYSRFADITADNNGSAEETAEYIISQLV
ncbi:MAG: shikimate kinase [Parasporobacterium sp.]|nr:shikimate kinase [Parasporobacterium sp.]